MSTFLINHARTHVWCAPRMDLQAIIKPARICDRVGVFNYVKVMWSTITLPTVSDRYFVYQIGQLHPSLMGLLDASNKWVSFAEACMATNLMVDLYNAAGLELPRSTSYYMVTDGNDLIMAVKDHADKIFGLQNEDLFIRVYSNAFFNDMTASSGGRVIEVSFANPRTNAAILDIQNKYQIAVAKGGGVIAWVNGRYVNTIDPFSVKLGDIVEFVRDASTLRIVRFKLSDLSTFESLLDQKRKYLLHYTGQSSDDIDYHDDIDFYLVKADTYGAYQGIYLHRNDPTLVRMVTHRDYALSVPTVISFIQKQGWNDLSDLYVIAFIRKGGWNRKLIHEANRISELYKLPENEILAAFTGLQSQVKEWRADTLEASAYSAIMRAPDLRLDAAMVETAYGYNNIAKLVGDSPLVPQVVASQKVVDLPIALMKESTIYEYDKDGLLLGWYNNYLTETYIVANIRTAMIEGFIGLGDLSIDSTYGKYTQRLDPDFDYRMYVCGMTDAGPDNHWRDVTGNGGMYTLVGNDLTWAVDPKTTYVMTRSNRNILAYGLNLSMTSGLLKFTLTERVTRDDKIVTQVMQVPMRKLEVFLNGRKLIRGLDFNVVFPQVIITNKRYLINDGNGEQQVAIRFSGLCDPSFILDEPEDYGFIQHGVLSKNNRYDLRDDLIQHISVDGYAYLKEELLFAETDLSVRPIDAKNGMPYCIEEIFVPFREITLERAMELRLIARKTDKAIADYMSLKMPESVIDGPSAIPVKYAVVSPFISRVLADLLSKVLWDKRMVQQYGTDLVKELCKPYEWLLEYDPISEDMRPNPNFVDIHPHPSIHVVDVPIYQFKFISMVIDYYAKGVMNFTNFARINGQ
jgi:hypothetical protein